MTPKMILTRDFALALEAVGLLPGLNTVRRFVVVAEDADAPPRVFVEQYGDERLLDIPAILAGTAEPDGRVPDDDHV